MKKRFLGLGLQIFCDVTCGGLLGYLGPLHLAVVPNC